MSPLSNFQDFRLLRESSNVSSDNSNSNQFYDFPTSNLQDSNTKSGSVWILYLSFHGHLCQSWLQYSQGSHKCTFWYLSSQNTYSNSDAVYNIHKLWPWTWQNHYHILEDCYIGWFGSWSVIRSWSWLVNCLCLRWTFWFWSSHITPFTSYAVCNIPQLWPWTWHHHLYVTKYEVDQKEIAYLD